MEPESHTAPSPEPKYKKTNILIVVFIIFSIIPALQSLGHVLICVLVDVFAVIGIIDARNPDRKSGLIDLYVFTFIGILLFLGTIANLVVDITSFNLETLSLTIYFVLVGISFFLNRWERDGKIF